MNAGNLGTFTPRTAMERFDWAKNTAQSGPTLPNVNSVDGTLFRFSKSSEQVDTVQIRNRGDMAMESLTYDRKTLMHCVKPQGLRAKPTCVTHQLGGN